MNDTIASVCKVMSSQEEDVEEAEVINEELTEGDAPLVDFTSNE